MEESPKIILPQDEAIKNALEKKLEEYKERLKPFAYVHPDLARGNSHYTNSLYKIAITEKLLKEGVVNTFELAHELFREYDFLDEKSYNNAAGVIDNYCKTGGKNTFNGTGFLSKK